MFTKSVKCAILLLAHKLNIGENEHAKGIVYSFLFILPVYEFAKMQTLVGVIIHFHLVYVPNKRSLRFGAPTPVGALFLRTADNENIFQRGKMPALRSGIHSQRRLFWKQIKRKNHLIKNRGKPRARRSARHSLRQSCGWWTQCGTLPSSQEFRPSYCQ